MLGMVALENARSSVGIAKEPQELPARGKHELTVFPVCIVLYFPREALGCLMQE